MKNPQRRIDIVRDSLSDGVSQRLNAALRSRERVSFTGHTVFEGISHGVGLYAIGKGLFIARSSHLQNEAAESLRKLLELAAIRHARETMAEPPAISDAEPQ